MRGDPTPDGRSRRYWKFIWNDLGSLPPIGRPDWEPKTGGLTRIFQEGTFDGSWLEAFPPVKLRKNLPALGRCLYCNRDRNENGSALKLTSEHIIPEFLGAGLELPRSSCADCQRFTARVEDAIAREMFDPVRTSFALRGKKGVPTATHFPLDVGRLTSRHEYIPLVHYPTILVMPFLFPASTFSRRPPEADDPFNFRIYNINADAQILRRYDLENLSTQAVDMARFAQFIAKIALAYAASVFDGTVRASPLAAFIRRDFPQDAPAVNHLEHLGCLWQRHDVETENLHEVEAGTISWNGRSWHGVRVRLFASYGMPSYYVTVAPMPDGAATPSP